MGQSANTREFTQTELQRRQAGKVFSLNLLLLVKHGLRLFTLLGFVPLNEMPSLFFLNEKLCTKLCPNGLASRRKFSSCVQLAFRLASHLVDL